MKETSKKLIVVLPSILFLFVLLLSAKHVMYQKKSSALLIHIKDRAVKVKSKSALKLEIELMYYGRDTIRIPFYFHTISSSKKEKFLLVDIIAQYKGNNQKKYTSFNNQIHYSDEAPLHYDSLIFSSKKKSVLAYIKKGLLDDPGKYKIKLVLTYYSGSIDKLKQVAYSNWLYVTVE